MELFWKDSLFIKICSLTYMKGDSHWMNILEKLSSVFNMDHSGSNFNIKSPSALKMFCLELL